jgi:hypothetical protein
MKYILVDEVQHAIYFEDKDALLAHLEDIVYDRLDDAVTHGTAFEVYEVGKAIKTKADINVAIKIVT